MRSANTWSVWTISDRTIGHGKAFYRAYRNYYGDTPEGNRILDKLPQELFRVHRNERGTTYYLTQIGLDWLGRQLHMKIVRG